MTVSRIATENDRLAIFKLAAQMHLETDFRFYDFDPGIAIAGLGDWLGGDPNSVMFVAEADGEVVGMLGATLRSTWFGRDKLASEELFYVDVAHRGSCAANQLLQSFCDWASEVGAQHLRAGVATGSSPAAERLYQRFGMHYVGGNFSLHMVGDRAKDLSRKDIGIGDVLP